MKFLLLTQHYTPEYGSASIKMSELAEYLSSKGHYVTVVTGFPNYPYGKVYEGYKMLPYKKEVINGVNVVRTPLYITSERRSFVHRMINHVTFMVTSIYGGFFSKKPDLIYYYSPPLFLGFSAWILGKLLRVPIVGEVNDLWPQAPIALGIIKNNFIKKLAEWFEKFVYKRTNYLFFYSNTMRDEVVHKGVSIDKTKIHPLWVSTGEFCPAPEENVLKLKTEYGLKGKFIIMYAGYIGLAQGLDVVIEAAKQLKEYSGITFVLVGGGPEKENLMKSAEDLRLDNIKFIPFQPKEKIPAFLSASDVLFAHLDPAPHRMGTIPAKVLAYMSMGKPLIVAARGETEDLVNRAGCGITVEPRNGKAIAKAALSLYQSMQIRSRMGAKGREQATKEFEKKLLLEKLESRLVDIVRNK